MDNEELVRRNAILMHALDVAREALERHQFAWDTLRNYVPAHQREQFEDNAIDAYKEKQKIVIAFEQIEANPHEVVSRAYRWADESRRDAEPAAAPSAAPGVEEER